MPSHSPVSFPPEPSCDSYANGELSEFAAPVDALVVPAEKSEEDSEPPLPDVPPDSISPIVHDDVAFSIHDFPFEEAQLSGYALHIAPNEPTHNSSSEITTETHGEVHNCAPVSDAPSEEATRAHNLEDAIDGCTTNQADSDNNIKDSQPASEFKSILEGFEDVTALDNGGKSTPSVVDGPSEEIKATDGSQCPEFVDMPKSSDVQSIDDVRENTIASSVDACDREANVPSEEIKRSDGSQDEQPPEFETIQIPPHWHPKPCVHVSCMGGTMTEEELSPILSKFGPVSSFTFENERHESAFVRYEQHENVEEFLEEVCQASNNTKLEDRTLLVEPFQPDSLLFVGNLTSTIDDSTLQEMFAPHGKIERAFVLYNIEGKSKCYGFVEFSLKSEAQAAKLAMGNMKMDGRVLRVEWSDCKKPSDMFSSVLFVDRLPREGSNIDTSLRDLFGKYGKVRGIHLATGVGSQYRGFAFVDFYHSSCADKAFQELEGHAFEGSNIRVNFANPSKSAQSYKFSYGSQAAQGYGGKSGSAGPGMTMVPALRGRASPLMHPHYMGSARPGMMGYGVGLQYGRGPYDRVPVSQVHGNGMGMLGPGSRSSVLLANVASRPRMMVGENIVQRMSLGQGMSITPAAIVQVATAQAKAREEEARARAEAAKQGLVRSGIPSHLASADRHQRYAHSAYQFKQSEASHGYPHAYQPSAHQQAILQQQYAGWNQQQHQASHVAQAQTMQYYSQPRQTFSHQQQNEGYYQQSGQQQQQYIQGYPYSSQYGQQQVYQQYGQQVNATNTQMTQFSGQQYQQPAQQSQTVYPQQNYEQFAQTQSQQHYVGSVNAGASSVQDTSQQQAYAAYYQQQEATQASAATMTPSTAQQSYEAQWAAYYASQAAYQQQTPAVDVGQKRTADQMEAYQSNQVAYNYAGYAQDGTVYQQQQQQQAQLTTTSAAAYQQPSADTTAYQQQATATASVPYQQQVVSGYQQQQPGAAAGYAPQASTAQAGYEQSTPLVTGENYPQLSTGAEAAQQSGVQGQSAVPDYSKRPRY